LVKLCRSDSSITNALQGGERKVIEAMLPVDPFDPELCIGTVIEVGPATVTAKLPEATPPAASWREGYRFQGGKVGDFVIVELDDAAIFGRITAVRLADDFAPPHKPGEAPIQRSIATIRLLTTITLPDATVEAGLTRYPWLGSRVYATEPALIRWLAEASAEGSQEKSPLLMRLGAMPAAGEMAVRTTPERLFGRHCAVIGATGGGKSWTLARLMEETGAFPGAKVILFDATGEFHTLGPLARHVQLGVGEPEPETCKICVFPYTKLTEGDLFALFRPSGPVQGPKLRQAIKSLKLAKIEPNLAANTGLLVRFQRVKTPIDQGFGKHSRTLEGVFADFDINLLVKQIQEECVYSSGGSANSPDHTRWGLYNEADKSECTALLGRIEDTCSSAELACLFQSAGKPSLIDEIDRFLDDPDVRILRISLRYLSFSYNAREIVADAIGRHLLVLGRDQRFRRRPIVVFLDEAHQFLNKALGDEQARYPLEAFDLLAKEGRKYSLSMCIATQRPSDIPEGVLSQIGTLLVHRLTNERDRQVVERASDELDRSAAEFLPTLAPGQAVLIGVAFPVPLTLQITPPVAAPDSKGSRFQEQWAYAEDRASPPPAVAAAAAKA
jgi:uncharacterized protein